MQHKQELQIFLQVLHRAEALLGSGAGTGAGSIQDFMSPFQQQVIDATLADFDQQRAIQEQNIRSRQAALGVLGAGRAGVELGQFRSDSDRARAALQAGLLQQGFGDAVARRQQDLLNQQSLAGQQIRFRSKFSNRTSLTSSRFTRQQILAR